MNVFQRTPPVHPETYPSQSKWQSAIMVVVAVIIVYEAFYLLSVPTAFIQLSLGFALLAVIIIAALRFSMAAALIVAAIANAYLLFAFAGPGRNIVPLQDILRGEWLLFLLFFAPAALIGYLSDRIKKLIQNERLAKEQAEHERQRLAAVIEQMPVGIVIAQAPEGTIILSNQHYEQMFGQPIEKVDNIYQYSDYPIKNESTGQPTSIDNWPITRIIKNKEAHIDEEFSYVQDNGRKITLRVKGVPVYSSNNNISSGLVLIDDITAQKEAEQRKDDFLSMVSHELKTPVTSIKMYSQLLHKQSQDGQPPHLQDSLARVSDQANRLHRLIDDILYLAKTQSGKLEYHFEYVEINKIVSEAIQDIQATQLSQEIIFKSNTKIKIQADCDRLSQVITNLVTNAVKYSPESNRIIVSLRKQEDHVIISVQDFGIGIAKREQKRIFERFYQVSQADGTTFPGLGIGLYFSAKVIQEHHGQIWVESQKGSGSTFYIKLPITP